MERHLPEHIAIIMDGNGRWAHKKGSKRYLGHKQALTAVEETTRCCQKWGIRYLTLFVFSRENWSRPKREVDEIMSFMVNTILAKKKALKTENIKFQMIGDPGTLPPKALKSVREVIDMTSSSTGMTLVLALNYSGRWDITQAFNALHMSMMESGKRGPIEMDTIGKFLSTEGIPDPELIIRTSGEMRISNFLLWQMAYSELYFSQVLWPDFREKHLLEALDSYMSRQRRFGKTGEQVG